MFKQALAAGAVALAAAGGAVALTGTAHAAPTQATATTHLTNRPDSGYQGNTWADDNLTRTVTIHLVGPDATAGLYDYTATLTDAGQADALTGATSPGAQAVPIKGAPVAQVTGSGTYAFTADTSQFSARNVPSRLSGDAGSTDSWPEYFFASGTTFTGMGINDWTWTYKDARLCQQWVDAYNGTQATSGDITGVSACPPPKPVIRERVYNLHASPEGWGNREVITWDQTVPAGDVISVSGYGHFSVRPGTGRVVLSGLRHGHEYTVTVTPGIKGAGASTSFRA
jgi:hypothetical protein